MDVLVGPPAAISSSVRLALHLLDATRVLTFARPEAHGQERARKSWMGASPSAELLRMKKDRLVHGATPEQFGLINHWPSSVDNRYNPVLRHHKT